MKGVHALPLLILVLLLVVTAAVTVLADVAVGNQERELLTERANEVNLVITNSISSISTNLQVLGKSYDLGGPSAFADAATAQISSSRSPASLALLRPSGPAFVVVTSVGPALHPGESVTGPPVPALVAAQHSSKMSATNLFTVGRARSLGFALGNSGGLVVYEQLTLGPVRAPSAAGTKPFSELRVVLYGSDHPASDQVLAATTGKWPLKGPVRYVPLMVGSTEWLTAVNAVHPLVGSVAISLPWLSLGVGVAGSVIVFLLLEGMARQRDLAVEALESEHRFAESLQRRLLPTVPELPGLDVASSYVPGADHQQVGGDWFDVFELSSGQVAVVIGDVMGHDVEAAAIMAQLRASLRSYATEGGDPAWTVERLSTFIDLFALPTVVTVVYGLLDPPASDGTRRFSWANAGHLPPLVREPDGRVLELNEGASPLLGAPASLPRPVGERMLAAGSTLLLYTDGLVESQGQNLAVTIDHLRQALGRADQPSAEQVCAAVLTTELPKTRRDDVALLVVRIEEVGTDVGSERSLELHSSQA